LYPIGGVGKIDGLVIDAKPKVAQRATAVKTFTFIFKEYAQYLDLIATVVVSYSNLLEGSSARAFGNSLQSVEDWNMLMLGMEFF
jgi:hypothetical protein